MKNRPQNIFFVLIFSMLLSACSVMKQARIINTPTVTAIPSSTSTPAATSTPSATPEPTMTPTVDPGLIEAAQKEQAFKNIKEYLNTEGVYSMEYFLDEAELFFGETELRRGELPLGIVGWHRAQFILLGNWYDNSEEVLHLYLGATDVLGGRVAFDYNFTTSLIQNDRNFPPVGIRYSKSGLLNSIGNIPSSNPDNLYTQEDWTEFMSGNISKPIAMDWYAESYVEMLANHNGTNDKMSNSKYATYIPQQIDIEFDKGMVFRIAFFEKLAKFGDAVRLNKIPLKLSEKKIQEQTTCLWYSDTFLGNDSLLNTCPTAYGLISIITREY